ncbi:MAG: alpha/beta hydrolase, partial [Armatimonadetes bacterium]|nr:alpha/beta hydrolase [Armatimonadota bacterium]
MTGGSKTMVTTACLVLLSGALPQDGTIEIREMLAIEPVGTRGRVPITTNAILAMIVAGTEIAPKEGDTVTLPDGSTKSWKRIEAAEDGWFSDRAFRGGFAYASFESGSERVMMLEASGHSWAYVNGKPRGGDPYAFGFSRYPVLVKRGRNDLLFRVSRGRVRAKLVEPEGEIILERRDPTLPDFMVGEPGVLHGAVILTNATTEEWTRLSISARVGEGAARMTGVGSIPPLMSRKVPFEMEVPGFESSGKATLTLRLVQQHARQPIDSEIEFELPIREAHELHKRTFVSKIDGSVQYYAVRPPFAGSLGRADGLVLTVHGAGVQATGQAAAYGSKSWAHIVAPTNRRPYGFDWEDWGRIDALEALADAKRVFQPREDRIYLTGHSMGGHGAWYLGAMHPDQWGAIGPAAGWISFWTYGGAVRYDDPDPIEALMIRVAGTSDITKVLRNYLHHGVFVLHGAEDGTVPISQPR